jgi:hypothetical protein
MSEEQAIKESKNAKRINLEDMIAKGSQKLAALIGLKLVAVVEMFPQEEGGWSMKLEFVEREGIPDTMDTIGLYEADFDQNGHLLRYSRQDMRKRGESYS